MTRPLYPVEERREFELPDADRYAPTIELVLEELFECRLSAAHRKQLQNLRSGDDAGRSDSFTVLVATPFGLEIGVPEPEQEPVHDLLAIDRAAPHGREPPNRRNGGIRVFSTRT